MTKQGRVYIADQALASTVGCTARELVDRRHTRSQPEAAAVVGFGHYPIANGELIARK